MPADRALLIAVPLRHLESVSVAGEGRVVLPAGGPGDLDSTAAGTAVLVMATQAGDAEVPAVTWRATYVGRAPYEPGAPWPEGLPGTWVAEHAPPPAPDPGRARAAYAGDLGDDWDAGDDADEDDDGGQAFLVLSDLQRLPRESWLFTNELVRKQARRGRSFLPRVPTLVDLPD